MINKIKYILVNALMALAPIFGYKCQSGGSNDVVYADDKGHQITLSDLKKEFEEEDNDTKVGPDIPDEAARLHQEAREHGGKGEYQQASEKLLKAMEKAPDWAYPVYDLAFTFLLQNDFSNALKYYDLTDKMEPTGFFTTKTACWTLRKEMEGVFPAGLYLAYSQLEWLDSAEEKLDLAKAIVEKHPNYAPAWKVISDIVDSPKEKLSAIENGLRANPDATTKGNLIVSKALFLNSQGKSEDAKRLLGNLVFDEDATFANIRFAKLVLYQTANKGK